MKSYVRRIGACAALLASGAAYATARANYFARAAEDQPAAISITIDNFSFTPKEITVSKGTTVTWINHDDVPHTVVSTDKKFKSRALDTDERFSFTFSDSGAYGYFCSVHPVMTGKVIVK